MPYILILFLVSFFSGCATVSRQPIVHLNPPPERPPIIQFTGAIVIDPGHGGKDPGTTGVTGQKEKEITIDIARRMQQDLESKGVKVVMTRDRDEFISLQERTSIASRPEVNLFVSVHANANKNHRMRGIYVYYSEPSIADRNEDQRKANEMKICGLFKMREDIPDLKKIVGDMLFSYKLRSSQFLARKVASELAMSMQEYSRSLPARFFVLRNTLVPAILVETGFLSNPREEKLLQDPTYRQKIADSITKAVLKFMRG